MYPISLRVVASRKPWSNPRQEGWRWRVRTYPNPFLQTLIEEHPTFEYLSLWAMLRFRDDWAINRKTIYRALQRLGWFVHQRLVTPRPRVQDWRSQATTINTRWAMDVTHSRRGGWLGASGRGHRLS